jgi:hypothetical protein
MAMMYDEDDQNHEIIDDNNDDCRCPNMTYIVVRNCVMARVYQCRNL